MFSISEKQQKALGAAARKSFLKELQLRLVERTPDLAQTLDEERLHTAVSRAVDAAETHGFTNRGPIRLYLDLCVGFGSGFVNDPVYSWAAKAIGNADPETQMERSEALFDKSLAAIDEISGPEDAYGAQALRALNTWAHESHDFPDLESGYAVSQMRSLHPEKAAHAGEEALQQLFRDAKAACLDLGVTTPRPIMLTTALKFGFGAGCLKDPFFPWIGATLSQEGVPQMSDRFKRLERKALTWVNAILSKDA